jgi:hypothetical protein
VCSGFAIRLCVKKSKARKSAQRFCDQALRQKIQSPQKGEPVLRERMANGEWRIGNWAVGSGMMQALPALFASFRLQKTPRPEAVKLSIVASGSIGVGTGKCVKEAQVVLLSCLALSCGGTYQPASCCALVIRLVSQKRRHHVSETFRHAHRFAY